MIGNQIVMIDIVFVFVQDNNQLLDPALQPSPPHLPNMQLPSTLTTTLFALLALAASVQAAPLAGAGSHAQHPSVPDAVPLVKNSAPVATQVAAAPQKTHAYTRRYRAHP